MMNIEQVIELVEKWLADPSSVTVEELEAAYAAADTAYWAGGGDADWAAVYAIAWAANSAANSPAGVAKAARHVAKYHELTKG